MDPHRSLVIFDLDGTLTVPVLDFDAIRAEIGLKPGPILEQLEDLGDGQRRRAEDILTRHERHAAQQSRMYPLARETVDTLRRWGFPVAVLTRNATPWARLVLDRHRIEVDALRTRDDGMIKPAPESVWELCALTGRDSRHSWMIGDHLMDLRTGQAAGCNTVLMVGEASPPDYAAEADHVISSLWALVEIITGQTEPDPLQ